MQRRYNNPFLEIQHLKEDLKRYIESTSPPPPEGSPSEAKIAMQALP